MTPADLAGRTCTGQIQQTIFLMVGLAVSQPLSAAPQDEPEFHGRLMIDFQGSERAISARLYGAPQDGSKGLLHLGLAAIFRDGHSTGLQFSARPGAHGSPQMIDTGLLPDARAATLALELTHASGQWTTVAEVMASSVQLPQKNGLTIGGAQVSAIYSFDDERSRWEPERGRWGRAQLAVDKVSIKWATRITFTDLDNGTIEGGAQFDWGSGLNLHFSSRSRLMPHYQRSERIGAGGGLDQLLIRVQMGF